MPTFQELMTFFQNLRSFKVSPLCEFDKNHVWPLANPHPHLIRGPTVSFPPNSALKCFSPLETACMNDLLPKNSIFYRGGKKPPMTSKFFSSSHMG